MRWLNKPCNNFGIRFGKFFVFVLVTENVCVCARYRAIVRVRACVSLRRSRVSPMGISKNNFWHGPNVINKLM